MSVDPYLDLYAFLEKEGVETPSAFSDVGPGWYPLLGRLFARMRDQGWDGKGVGQIKQKFGGLRVYLDFAEPDFSDAIKQAEAEAWQTCERCGAPGTRVVVGGWIFVACDEHAKGGVQ